MRVTRLDTVPERASTSFSAAQERFANLAFELLSHPDLPPHVKAFTEAVKAIVEGQPDAVERIDALVDAEEDGVRTLAHQIRSELHYDACTFQALRDQLVAWGQTPAALPIPASVHRPKVGTSVMRLLWTYKRSNQVMRTRRSGAAL